MEAIRKTAKELKLGFRVPILGMTMDRTIETLDKQEVLDLILGLASNDPDFKNDLLSLLK